MCVSIQVVSAAPSGAGAGFASGHSRTVLSSLVEISVSSVNATAFTYAR